MKYNLIFTAALLFISSLSYSTDILFFNQDCNVDIPVGSDGTCQDERHNLLQAITAAGHNVTLLSDFHESNMDQLLLDHDFLMIPDLEDGFGDCNISDPSFISPSEVEIIRNYVEAGGRLMITGSSQNIDFLNSTFNLGLVSGGFVSTGISSLNESEALGTPFETCPTTITNYSATFLVTSTMPESKKCIYQSDSNASLAVFTVGSGTVTYIGFDFNEAGPECVNSGVEWVTCGLTKTIEILSTPTPTVPTLSEWSLILLALLFMILSVVSIRASNIVIA